MDDGNRRLYRVVAGGLAVFGGVITLMAGMLCLNIVVASHSQAGFEEVGRFVSGWNDVVEGTLGRSEYLINSIAALPVFVAPQDYAEYKTRFSPNVRGRRGENIGQGLHGLPLSDPRGKPLLRSQRQLAAALLRVLPHSVAVAEFDSLGRFVFVEPYGTQVPSVPT